MDGNDAKNLAIGILIGAAVGMVAGLLLAPKSGAESRTYLRDKALAVREKASALKERVSHRGEEEMAEAK